MTVAELEQILARLPEDMIVVVGFPGEHVVHVETVNAETWPTRSPRHRCETGRCEVLDEHDGSTLRVPPRVRISSTIGWADRGIETDPRSGAEPPAVQLGGRSHWRERRVAREISA